MLFCSLRISLNLSGNFISFSWLRQSSHFHSPRPVICLKKLENGHCHSPHPSVLRANFLCSLLFEPSAYVQMRLENQTGHYRLERAQQYQLPIHNVKILVPLFYQILAGWCSSLSVSVVETYLSHWSSWDLIPYLLRIPCSIFWRI